MKITLRSILILTFFLLFDKLSFAQPSLGTTSSFVVFTTNGDVSNFGNSHLTGNTGNTIGTYTVGINIDGVEHIHDSAATTAAADLSSLYTQLNNASVTNTPSSPVLGNSTTLNPGVYKINVAGSVNGDLTLSGSGVYIFQFQDIFNTTGSARIILTNGAKACDVFWKTEGTVNLGANTVMKGTIVANNAAIIAGSNVDLEGRLFSTTGAIDFTILTATIPLGCSVPVLNGPIAPVDGEMDCFTLFTSNGDLSDINSSTLKGDVGSNFGTASGYNSGNVTGTIHASPDVVTQIAADTLSNVNTYLSGLIKDIDLLYPSTFGNGLVLTPHTYLLSGATSLTDTLYINAQGNADAVFVIKISGSFAANAGSVVKLINGAQAGNVFWKITGVFSTAGSAILAGTFVSNSHINLTSITNLQGRALTTGGNITTDAIVAEITQGCESVLPVTWLYFRGKPENKNVLLEWGTALEINNNYFLIERSIDGKSFETLGQINSSGDQGYNYSFIDYDPFDMTYYRLMQMDFNGSKDYAGVIYVKIKETENIKIVNFVDAEFINVEVSGATHSSYGTLELFSIMGQKISSQKILIGEETGSYKLPKPEQKGIYLIYLNSETAKPYTVKIYIQ